MAATDHAHRSVKQHAAWEARITPNHANYLLSIFQQPQVKFLPVNKIHRFEDRDDHRTTCASGADRGSLPSLLEGISPLNHFRPQCGAPVPRSAAIIDNVKQTYANQTWTSCDGSQQKSNRYGYQRCVTYQVKDQNGDDLAAVLAISEAVTVVDPGNYNANMKSGNSSTNAAGQFLDDLALLGPSILPSNACSIVKQSFTATGNSSPIRVNCVQYSSTEVTIADVTSDPGQCSQPTYHCN